MGFTDASERTAWAERWEARRVAAAFKGTWITFVSEKCWTLNVIGDEGLYVDVTLVNGDWVYLVVHGPGSSWREISEFDFSSQAWRIRQNELMDDHNSVEPWEYYAICCSGPPPVSDDYDRCLVCGLCRLGVEDEELFAELNYELSAHEKLELRLSMPREFWPTNWRGKEEH